MKIEITKHAYDRLQEYLFENELDDEGIVSIIIEYYLDKVEKSKKKKMNITRCNPAFCDSCD